MKSVQTEAAPSDHVLPLAGPSQKLGWWSGLPPLDAPIGGRGKRAFDVTIALALLLLLSPMLIGLAVLVRLSSPGPVLYGHARVGYRNRPFRCLKLRTMVINGDEVIAAHFRRYPDARREWEEKRKLRDDPRVTPVGHVLRKLSLDELPQLLNVVRGEMSLVGPRPIPDDELRRYGRSLRFYVQARPGITGLWQVSGRNTTTYGRRVAFDRWYVAHFSTANDLLILARTLPAAVRSGETA